MKRSAMPVLFMLTTVVVVSACGDDEIDNTVDCAQICAKFDECIAEIDVGECTDRCEDEADSSSTIEQDADSCEECIEGATCEEAEPCWADCPVVPVVD